MEKTTNSEQLDFVFELFRSSQTDEMNYVYRGLFTQSITDNILSLAEVGLDKAGESQKIKRRVYLIMVEGLQNITKHQDTKVKLFDEAGFFHIQKKGFTFYITTGNLIRKDRIDYLKEHLERINSLGKDELKKFYKRVLTKGEISQKGGAGLGLIEIARKSGKQLDFDFRSYNDDFSFFYLHTEVFTGSVEERDKDRQASLSLDNIITLHQHLSELKIFLIFNSAFSQESLIYLLSIIEPQIINSLSSKKKVYNVIVEMLQNIIHHGVEIHQDKFEGKPGIFYISEKDEDFVLSAGNYVENKHKESLKSRIDFVNSIELNELDDFYNKRLLNLEIDSSKESGLGIIDIRLKTEALLTYKFYQIDEKFSFFTIQTSVKKN